MLPQPADAAVSVVSRRKFLRDLLYNSSSIMIIIIGAADYFDGFFIHASISVFDAFFPGVFEASADLFTSTSLPSAVSIFTVSVSFSIAFGFEKKRNTDTEPIRLAPQSRNCFRDEGFPGIFIVYILE